MLRSHCLWHVSTNLHIAYAAIYFWLLLTQLVSVDATSNSNSSDSAVSTLSPPRAHPDLGQRPQLLVAPPPPLLPPPPPLMDKTLTHCGSEDNTNWWRPVCTTANSVDYVLFASECLLRETNRESHYLDTGEAKPVFRKIAMGFCRPNCSVVICERNEQPICARNLQSNEVRRFRERCELARDVCLNDMDWQPIADKACGVKPDKSLGVSEITKATSLFASTTIAPPTTPKAAALSVQAKKLFNYQTKHLRKAIPCAKVFSPVCAELFGVKATFINECLVNAENVNFGKNWQIFSKGVCEEDYASSRANKHVINRRSTVGSVTVTYQLNAPETNANGNVACTSNTTYDDGTSANTAYRYTRILPAVNDHVTFCKFGAGPVCGSSAKNTMHCFDNICELLLRNIILKESWSVVNEGKCKKCILNCDTNYDPICISRNGRNYTVINQCHLDYDICRKKYTTAEILGRGECDTILKNINGSKLHYSTRYTTPPSTTNAEYFPRHARKTVGSSARRRKPRKHSKLADEKLRRPLRKNVLQQESTTPTFNEDSTDSSTKKSFDVTTSHVMNLWRSSKKSSVRSVETHE
ncbi:uncharacterized protein LOC129251172 [Anastrepha obliqua]|uniref:uncharacterized protein LOC129251172 n=1 Tax=Anastrepha obliqua TaxID=95512 RepID=UPI00240A6F3D|nr:uncharacterized protein LOC129251172 [Anastrepha obliqua]